jgi:hypothetical protein
LNTEKHKTGKNKVRFDKHYPEKCEDCDFRPYDNKSYIQHKLSFHASIEEKKSKFRYYCEKCNFGTYAEIHYNNHIVTIKHKAMSEIKKE